MRLTDARSCIQCLACIMMQSHHRCERNCENVGLSDEVGEMSKVGIP